MNILHCEASDGWGGQEIRILKESLGMRARGHNLFFAIQKKGKLGEELRKENFPVVELNFKKTSWLYTFFRLFWIMIWHQIDIVNTHSSLDAWIAGIVARILRKPIIRTRHLSTPIKPGWNSKILYHGLADFVVTTCEKIVSLIVKQAEIPIDRCLSVPTGVDPDSLEKQKDARKSFRKNYHIPPDAFLVGMVCFMRSWKGIEEFLRAVKELEAHPKIHWVLIGGGHIETYRKRAHELGITKNLTFTGHLENPIPAIEELDLFLLLSTASEGVSQASLQAAYLKKPLVMTPTGGLCEVCKNQITGLQVSPFCHQEVVQAVLTLYQNPILSKTLGEAAHELVCQQFTNEHMMIKMEMIYTKITKKVLH